MVAIKEEFSDLILERKKTNEKIKDFGFTGF